MSKKSDTETKDGMESLSRNFNYSPLYLSRISFTYGLFIPLAPLCAEPNLKFFLDRRVDAPHVRRLPKVDVVEPPEGLEDSTPV